MAISSVVNNFVKLFIIRNDLLYHLLAEILFNFISIIISRGWLFLNQWFGLQLSWLFSNNFSKIFSNHSALLMSLINVNDFNWQCCSLDICCSDASCGDTIRGRSEDTWVTRRHSSPGAHITLLSLKYFVVTPETTQDW